MFGPRTYNPADHDFFDEVATLFINLASLNTATEAFAHSITTIPATPDHTLYLSGKVAHASFPIHRLMHTVVANAWPTQLDLAFMSGIAAPNTSSHGVQLQSNAMANMIVQLVGTAFLKYYERNADRLKQVFSPNPKCWPEEWRFAWLLRNAIAHGDKWLINDPKIPQTAWHGVSVAPSDTDQQWFNLQRFIGGGDVLLLMEELNTSLGRQQ